MNQLDIYSKTLDYIVSLMSKVKEGRKKKIQKGELVNTFTLWNSFSGISETVHSRILHFLLSDNPMHGQGLSFLKRFLEPIGIEVHENDEWVVTAEIGRVDIMLKRFHPHCVVIIENKSNNAVDQPNQLYRYWYENIHSCDEDCKSDYYNNHKEYRIYYLVPDPCKDISDNSLAKPSGYPEGLPQKLPIKPVILSFRNEINNWLEACISSLPKENTPLINFLTQYKEYCKSL